MRGFEEKRETLIHRTPAKSTRDCSAALVHTAARRDGVLRLEIKIGEKVLSYW